MSWGWIDRLDRIDRIDRSIGSRGSRVYHGARVNHGTPRYIMEHCGTPQYTMLYHRVPLHTTLHRGGQAYNGTPRYTADHGIPPDTLVYNGIPYRIPSYAMPGYAMAYRAIPCFSKITPWYAVVYLPFRELFSCTVMAFGYGDLWANPLRGIPHAANQH